MEGNIQAQDPTPAPQVTMLVGPIELIKSAWSQYKRFFKTLVAVAAVPMLALAIVQIINMKIFTPENPVGGATNILGLILTLAAFAISAWAAVSMIMAIQHRSEGMTAKEALTKSWRSILGYWWLAILSFLVMVGGFTLFIIPGIIFWVWFAFASIIFVVENKRGLDAMKQSREYNRNYWWPIFGRLLFMAAIAVVLFAVLGWIVSLLTSPLGVSISLLFNYIVTAVIVPLIVLYSYLLYENIKSVNPSPAPKMKYGFLIGFAIWGIIAPILIFVFAGGAIVSALIGSVNQNGPSEEQVQRFIEELERLDAEGQIDLNELQNLQAPAPADLEQ